MSDTTNLAPAMAGTDLFTHIKYMTHTTVLQLCGYITVFYSIGAEPKSHGSLTNYRNAQRD